MLAVLNVRFTQPTLVCLSQELVVNRSTIMQSFARLRNRETDAIGFCLRMLGQVKNAQVRALAALSRGRKKTVNGANHTTAFTQTLTGA